MKLHEIIGQSMAPQLDAILSDFVTANMKEFADVCAQFPGDTRKGSISDIEAFWLYFMIKSLKPKRIIESGTLYGYSLYFMAMAAGHGCEVHSFDIDQSSSHKFGNVQYHERDWMDCPSVGCDNDTVVFFDDHIDHGRRYDESVGRGARHIFFHDNYTYPCSHRSIRYYALPDADLFFIFPNSVLTGMAANKNENSDNYRWLTYIRRK